jgi:hypothetical protein
MRGPIERDPIWEQAREEAQGTEVYEDAVPGGSLEVECEEAQGVEVFSNPDATLAAGALQEGSSGHETFTGDKLGLGSDVEEERDG